MAATVSALLPLQSISIPTSMSRKIPIHSHRVIIPNSHFQSHQNLILFRNNKPYGILKKLRSVEEETLIPESEEAEASSSTSTEQPSVTVPVSPSDTLTMFFQAEGILSESAIPTVTKALEVTEGIAHLKIQVVEGIASVELAKQTTVQASGVASSLVEIIQGSGFKLQTLKLSFKDEEEVVV